MKGSMVSWIGICTNPQYQETSVNISSESGKATGNAKLPNVFFNDGYMESCSSVITTSQLITEKTCCSTVRLFSSTQFCVQRRFDTRDHPIPEEVDRNYSPGKGNEVLDQVIDNCNEC